MSSMELYFVVTIVVGGCIGLAACLPEPRKGTFGVVVSAVIGMVGAGVGWTIGIAIGAVDVSESALLFLGIVAAGTAVAIYQAATSERPELK